jgi:type III secretion protein V
MQALLERLTKLAKFASERAEIAAVIVVMGIVFMLILPLPTLLIDGLIALNICLSSILVVLALYLSGSLAFSTFPAVLLITTLFRLALEVSTTRLILLEGDAGHIVQAFGQFVVGGNLVVGLVIFLILTIVQFLVITKGTERVAEVSARFSLDAMPGKQMSIDSDLRAGLIEASEARRRRDELGKESQLFGAMDGAMKFVKGDAIAGLIIVAVNLIGGIAIGVLQRDLSVGQAVKIYSILTIGDGLIAQIPALLISLCAGLMITRVSQGGQKQSNVGQEIAVQLFSQPKALIIASGVMVIFALVPGMPTLVFFMLALLTGASGWFMTRQAAAAVAPAGAALPGSETEDILTFTVAVPLRFAISEADLADARMIHLINDIRQRRNHLVEYFGMILPALQLTPMTAMPAGHFCFDVYEVPVLSGPLRWDALYVAANAEQLAQLNISVMALQAEVVGCWVSKDQQNALDAAGVVYLPFENHLAQEMEKTLRRHASKFIGLNEAQLVMDWVMREIPLLAREVERVLPASKIAEVLQKLVGEQVAVRNLRRIVETLFEWGQRERDPGVLADFVRIALQAQLCHEVAPDHILHAILLTPASEELLRNAIRQTAHGSFLALNTDQSQQLLRQLHECLQAEALAQTPDPAPIVMLVAQDLRRYVRGLLEETFFDLPVMSHAELVPHIRVQPVGRV